MADYLDIARRTLAELKAKGLYPDPTPQPAPTPDPEPTVAAVRKGQAVCLASDLLGERIWIVADDEDATLLRAQEPGVTYTRGECELLLAVDDPVIVKEIHQFKRTFGKGKLTRP